MALLVDKLRPRTLDALTYHHDLSARLKSLVSGAFLGQNESSILMTGYRLKAEIFHIYLSTDLLEQVKRRE